MDLSEALVVFKLLEAERFTEEEGDPPKYDVRLDASTTRGMDGGDRSFRIRVTATDYLLDRDGWLYVLEVAGEHGLEVDVQNSGMELR